MISRKGFTFIEIIFTIFISIIIIGVLLSTYIFTFKIWDMIFIRNKINNHYIDTAERLLKKRDETNLPYETELVIQNIANKTIRIYSIIYPENLVNNDEFNYQIYLRDRN